MKVSIPLVKVIPLDALMRERGVSNRKLAALTGLSPTTINALRLGRSTTTVATAKKVLTALGVSEDMLQ